MSTLADLYTLANFKYQRITDAGSEEISDAQWKVLFEEAVAQLGCATPTAGDTLISLVSDQQEYALPSDFHAVHSVSLLEGDVYKEIPRLFVTDETSRGYRIYDGNIYIQPTPSASLADGVKLYYYSSFAGLPASDDDEVGLGDDGILVEWALSEVLRSDGNLTAAREHERKFIERKATLGIDAFPLKRRAHSIWG